MAYCELLLGFEPLRECLVGHGWGSRRKGEGEGGELEGDRGGVKIEKRPGAEKEGNAESSTLKMERCSLAEETTADAVDEGEGLSQSSLSPSKEAKTTSTSTSRSATTPTASPTSSLSSSLPPLVQKRPRTTKIVCLGGGAGAELVGFAGAWAAAWNLPLSPHPGSPNDTPAAAASSPLSSSADTLNQTNIPPLHITLLDLAPWGPVLSGLYEALTNTLLSSSDPSSTTPITTANPYLPSPFCKESLTYAFHQINLLSSSSSIAAHVADATLVTVFFTLNELYAASRVKTTALILGLGEMMAVGARLVVVDSAGSYAGVGFGGLEAGEDCHGGKGRGAREEESSGDAGREESRREGEEKGKGKGKGGGERRYPMQWLLDHTLLEIAGSKEGKKWTKILGEDSRWFRRGEGLEYPVPLEDMRYQVHVYERM